MTNGCVYLVGAGPGDRELITAKGLRLIRQADVILYDGLANPELLSEARPDCETVNVEKRPGAHRVVQEEINRLMVDHGRAGKQVVRLKGGDPIIFGRAGEEAEMLRNAGIPFEIVPGVTSAIAAPAYAGIPVTHRGVSTHVTLVTGTTAALEGQREVDWEALARGGGTLLILMGTRHRADIAARLMRGGRSADTPVAAIHWATTAKQQTQRTTLAGLAEAPITNPSVIVVGDVAAMDLAWFESRPLFGRTIAVTRARTQSSALVDLLRGWGASVIEVPTIEFDDPDTWDSVDQALAPGRLFDWVVFTSANGVERFFDRAFSLGKDVRVLGNAQIAAIGAATAARIREFHLNVALVPESRVAEGLAAALVQHATLSEKRVLIVRPEQARDVLPSHLRTAGAEVCEAIVYKTVKPNGLPGRFKEAFDAKEIDMVTFTSSSTVRNFADLVKEAQLTGASEIPAACIGPITAETARASGFDVVVEAATDDISVAGMAERIREYYVR